MFVKILHLKAIWIILGAVSVAISAFVANVFIPNTKLAPLVPMMVSVTVLAIILLYDKNDDENREWTLSSWGFAKLILPLLAVGVLTAGFLLSSTHDGIELSRYYSQQLG